jgi:lysozyme
MKSPNQSPSYPHPIPGQRSGLAALIGAPCAVILCLYVPQFEGEVLRGYRDPIGIVTACSGHTATAVIGKPYTRDECERLLQEDLVSHAEGVLKCVPQLKGQTGPLAASTSFAFNVGVSKFCHSTMAAKLRAGDVRGACAELPKWVYAGGKQLPGLVKRREAERAICEGKIA